MEINMIGIIFAVVLVSDIWYLVKACKSLSRENKTIAKIEKDVVNLELKCFKFGIELQKMEHQIEKGAKNNDRKRKKNKRTSCLRI